MMTLWQVEPAAIAPFDDDPAQIYVLVRQDTYREHGLYPFTRPDEAFQRLQREEEWTIWIRLLDHYRARSASVGDIFEFDPGPHSGVASYFLVCSVGFRCLSHVRSIWDAHQVRLRLYQLPSQSGQTQVLPPLDHLGRMKS